MLMCCCPQGGKAQTTEVFGLKQGVNIGDWLSQKANISFKESDVQMLSNLKYDHIRIPVDESRMFNADGSKNAESFTKLHTAVEWARKYNLKVIVDLHILNDNTSSGSMKSFVDDFEDGQPGKWKPNSSSGIQVEIADNPDASGINKSQKVLHITQTEASNWKGAERREVMITPGVKTFKYMRFRVRKNKTGYITFKFEAEDGTVAYQGYDVKTPNQWIEADVSPYHKLEGKRISRITIRPDNDPAELWIDDIAFSTSHSGYRTSISKTLWNDNNAQQHFVELWRQIQGELKQYPNNLLAYELLNEPTAPTAVDWNQLAAKALAAIRMEEPDRKVVIGSNLWNNVTQVPLIEVPANDKNIILTFHFYNPHLLTHYQASWQSLLAHITAPVQYPGLTISDTDFQTLGEASQKAIDNEGRTFDKAKIKALIGQAVTRAQALGLEVWCGEFGCYNRTPVQSRLRWIEDVAQVCREYGVGHCLWNFQGGFGFVAPGQSKVADPYMLNAQVDWERLNIASLKNNADVKAFADENTTGAYGADKAVDGIYSTRWGAGNNTGACSWWIDLGKTYAVSMICPLWENYARQYEVYMATEKGADGIPVWGTIPAVSQDKRLGEYIRTYISDGVAAGNYISDPHVFDSPVKARYIKIKQLRSASASWGSSLWEMQVLGTPENAGTSIGKTTACHAENPAHACPGIYTLSGVKVHQKPARGDIYLQGGRKYVMR
ncbi:MAG: cellulase family glycosylhydrolase [Prevotellaceae bacterium]|nr:cellulase family glycosylhydrolase [Prevotellaceae bacterium]